MAASLPSLKSQTALPCRWLLRSYPDSPQDAIDLIPVIEEIRTAIAEPVEINGQWVTVTTSMGIAIFPEDGGDPESLMRSADAAMYAAKQAGRNGFRFHS